MKYSLFLSSSAKNDLISITEYTLQRWGEKQADIYLSHIDKALLAIQHAPHIGRVRTDISDRHRCFSVEKHLIIYFIQDDSIMVSRIVHQSRDVEAILL